MEEARYSRDTKIQGIIPISAYFIHASARLGYTVAMATEIDLGGTIYISSKNAAEKTGYTQDYIGQLARGGQIEARRVSGMWYILEQSLRDYKEKADQFVPIPPQGFQPSTSADVSVSFDGKDYISANRAAKITGYNQDYIGQLARSGEVLSRQVGNRWYVDRESLLAHKKEKDGLLAAVQVQSVGLAKPESIPEPEKPAEAAAQEEVTHFEYVREEVPLIPDIPPVIPEVEVEEPEPMPEFPRRKVAAPIFEEYREALRPTTTPIAIRKIDIDEPTPEPEPQPEPEIETPAPRPTPVAFKRELPPEPAPEPEFYVDSLDAALDPHMKKNPVRVAAAHVEETVYIEEDAPKPRKAKNANIFIMSGIAVAAAIGTLVYIGSSLGFLNLGGMIPGSQPGQNAAVANSVIENGSATAFDSVRNLFSKELVYQRQ